MSKKAGSSSAPVPPPPPANLPAQNLSGLQYTMDYAGILTAIMEFRQWSMDQATETYRMIGGLNRELGHIKEMLQ